MGPLNGAVAPPYVSRIRCARCHADFCRRISRSRLVAAVRAKEPEHAEPRGIGAHDGAGAAPDALRGIMPDRRPGPGLATHESTARLESRMTMMAHPLPDAAAGRDVRLRGCGESHACGPSTDGTVASPRVALLIADELGYPPCERTGDELLVNVLADRERARGGGDGTSPRQCATASDMLPESCPRAGSSAGCGTEAADARPGAGNESFCRGVLSVEARNPRRWSASPAGTCPGW